MSQSVNVNFKLDADVKSMEQVCSELGLSMSAAFTVFKKSRQRKAYSFFRHIYQPSAWFLHPAIITVQAICL